MSIAKQLYELQEIDLAIEANERKQAEIVSRLGESQEVVNARQRLAAADKQLAELKQSQHSLDWEIDDITAKIAKAEGELYSGRIANPKELASLEQEIKLFKARCRELEDKDLEVMEQLEAASAGVEGLKSKLSTLEAEGQHQQTKLRAELQELEAELGSLKQQRETALAQLSKDTVEHYGELKAQKGTAVAKVEQGVCRRCRLSLSNAELQRARGERLTTCSSCGRILFIA